MTWCHDEDADDDDASYINVRGTCIVGTAAPCPCCTEAESSREMPYIDPLTIISAKCGHSEHWRRLRDCSICTCFCCPFWLLMAMTSLHQQHKQQRRLLLFLPSAKRLFLLPSLSLLYCVVVDFLVFVGVVVVVLTLITCKKTASDSFNVV